MLVVPIRDLVASKPKFAPHLHNAGAVLEDADDALAHIFWQREEGATLEFVVGTVVVVGTHYEVCMVI